MFAISCKKIFNRIIHKIIDQYYNDWPFGNDGMSLFWWRCDFRANMFFVNKLHDRLAATAAHAKAVLIVIIDHDTLFCAAMNTEIDAETPESVRARARLDCKQLWFNCIFIRAIGAIVRPHVVFACNVSVERCERIANMNHARARTLWIY